LRRAWFEKEGDDGDVRGRTITGERVINLEEGEEREKERYGWMLA